MPIKPIDDASLLGDILPNVYVQRIILDHRSVGDVITRGDNPHFDFPLWKSNPGDDEPLPHYGLVETKTKSSPSGWLADQASQAENFNQPLLVKIDFLIKDVVENKLISSYLTTDQIKKMLKIFIFVSTSEWTSNHILEKYNFSSLAQALSDPSVAFAGFPGIEGSKVQGLSDFDPKISNNNISDYTNSKGQKVYDVVFSTDISLENSNPKHLMVFAHAFIDQNTFENSFSPPVKLTMNPQLSSLLIGKLTAEPVFLNGELVDTAHYYEDTDGKIWLGPVSLQYPQEIAGLRPDQIAKLKGTPVKGNINAIAPGPGDGDPLKEVTVPNSIIQDFRVRSQIQQLAIDFSSPEKLFTQNYKQLTKKQFAQNKANETESFFSDLMHTRNYLNQVKMTFAVDVANLYSHKSKYGKLWENISVKDRLKLTSGLVFKNITLMRRRLKKTGLANSPSNMFDESAPIEIIAKGSLNENFALSYGKSQGRFGRVDIKPPMQDSLFAFRLWTWFAGIDEEIATSSPGNYQYGIRYTFEDRLETLVENKVAALQNQYVKLKGFYKNSLKPQYYDNIRDSFTQMYKKWETNNYINVVLPTLASFIDVHQLFTGGDFSAKEKMALNLQNISCPQTGNPDGLLFIVELVEKFLALLGNIMGSKALGTTSSGASNTYAPKRVTSKKANFVQERYWFKETVESYKDNNMGYEFLKFIDLKMKTSAEIPAMQSYNEIAGLSLLTYENFEARARAEATRYFVSDNVKFKLRVKGSGPDVSSTREHPPDSPREEMYSYFAPSFIKTTNLGFYPTCHSYNIDYKTLNLYMLEIYKSKLAPRNAAYKVNEGQVTGLSIIEKQEKYQLNQVLGLKGVTFVNNMTEGVSLFDYYNVEDGVYPILESNFTELGGNLGEPQPETDEQIPQPVLPVDIEENNFNDALFFLSDVDRTGGSSAFHWFLEKINKKHDYGRALMQMPMPNHYKYLLRLNNPEGYAIVNSDGIVPIKNLVDIPTAPEDIEKQFPQSGFKNRGWFGYHKGFQTLDTIEKKFGLWMSFFNLVEVQYFYGFQGGVNKPVFKKLTQADFVKFRDQQKVLLCRLVNYRDMAMVGDGSALIFRGLSPPEDIAFKLPIFDEYFLLGTEEHLTKFTGNIDFEHVSKISSMFLKMQQKMNTMEEVSAQYLNTAPSTKQLSKVQQQVSHGLGAAGKAPGGLG